MIAELERSCCAATTCRAPISFCRNCAARCARSQPAVRRVGNPRALFFQPLEPFLVDDAPTRKHPGRIARVVARSDLGMDQPRSACPAKPRPYSDEVSRALDRRRHSAQPNSWRAPSRIASIQRMRRGARRRRGRRQGDAAGSPRRSARRTRSMTSRAILGAAEGARCARRRSATQLPGHITQSRRRAARTSRRCSTRQLGRESGNVPAMRW